MLQHGIIIVACRFRFRRTGLHHMGAAHPRSIVTAPTHRKARLQMGHTLQWTVGQQVDWCMPAQCKPCFRGLHRAAVIHFLHCQCISSLGRSHKVAGCRVLVHQNRSGNPERRMAHLLRVHKCCRQVCKHGTKIFTEGHVCSQEGTTRLSHRLVYAVLACDGPFLGQHNSPQASALEKQL